MDKVRFAYALKQIRKTKNISQIRLGKSLNKSATYVSDIESCFKEINDDTAIRIAEYFEVPFSYMQENQAFILKKETLIRKIMQWNHLETYSQLQCLYIDELIDKNKAYMLSFNLRNLKKYDNNI